MTPERTKEEILPQAAEHYYWTLEDDKVEQYPVKARIEEAFKAGAKWQESQPVESKSDDDVLEDHVTITLSFNIPTFGRFCDLMKTDSEMWPDLKEALKQLKATIEETKEK